MTVWKITNTDPRKGKKAKEWDRVKQVGVWSFGKKIESQRHSFDKCVCVQVQNVYVKHCVDSSGALWVSEVSSRRFASYNHTLTLRRSGFCSQPNGILAPFLNLNEDDSWSHSSVIENQKVEPLISDTLKVFGSFSACYLTYSVFGKCANRTSRSV